MFSSGIGLVNGPRFVPVANKAIVASTNFNVFKSHFFKPAAKLTFSDWDIISWRKSVKCIHYGPPDKVFAGKVRVGVVPARDNGTKVFSNLRNSFDTRVDGKPFGDIPFNYFIPSTYKESGFLGRSPCFEISKLYFFQCGILDSSKAHA